MGKWNILKGRGTGGVGSFLAFALLSALGLAAAFALLLLLNAPAGALSEYAVLTGEPCGSCHVSAAGGGMRGVRGQAWVLSGRPAQVPSQAEALQALGIRLSQDTSLFTLSGPPSVPAPLDTMQRPGALTPLYERLQDYEGN